jgi:hypothetical protein
LWETRVTSACSALLSYLYQVFVIVLLFFRIQKLSRYAMICSSVTSS